MSEFRLSPEAEAELDDIWLYIARESGSIDIATRVLEGITERFWLLAKHPYTWVAHATKTCAEAYAAFRQATTSSSTGSRKPMWC